MTDGLSQAYAELLDGSYDSLDRIVLNAYFRFAQSPAGFRVWCRQLRDSDEDLDNAHLIRLAGQFRRRLRAWALANNVPIKVCKAGEHKFEIADEYHAKTDVREGVFLIIEGRAQAPVFDVLNSGRIQVKRPYPYVNHFSFHILDEDWGHIVIKLSGHPPFPAQIILNGHEYLARQAERNGIPFTKEGNCFTQIETSNAFAAMAETLLSERAVGLLTAVCDRWIYKACLCFALDVEERKRSRFRYEYSTYQLEYSRNLLFKRGSEMEQVVEALIDRNRTRMDVERLKTILGRKTRPHARKKRKSAQLQIVVERLRYGLTIFKVYCGKVALKIYTKGEHVLRTEAMAIDTRSLSCGRDIGRFAAAASTLKKMLERFLNVLTCMDRCFVGPDTLEELSSPSKAGTARTGGIDLNRPRMRCVARAILALSIRPSGFSASQLVITGRYRLASNKKIKRRFGRSPNLPEVTISRTLCFDAPAGSPMSGRRVEESDEVVIVAGERFARCEFEPLHVRNASLLDLLARSFNSIDGPKSEVMGLVSRCPSRQPSLDTACATCPVCRRSCNCR